MQKFFVCRQLIHLVEHNSQYIVIFLRFLLLTHPVQLYGNHLWQREHKLVWIIHSHSNKFLIQLYINTYVHYVLYLAMVAHAILNNERKYRAGDKRPSSFKTLDHVMNTLLLFSANKTKSGNFWHMLLHLP